MENKNVGYLLLAVSILIVITIFLFNSALKEILVSSCTEAHGDVYSCPLYESISKQTYLSLGIVGLLLIVSLILIFSKPQERIIFRKVELKTKRKKIDKSELNKEEKQILELIEENKAVFQADLIEKTKYGKAKMTRILDRLEGKGFVERKRRGMTNVVVLKE